MDNVLVTPRAGQVFIVFADTGPGIPESQREAIFEPFYTTRGEGGAMGMGLYVSNDLVKRNGGDLRIEHSELGAKFVVSLPGIEGF